MNKGTKVIIAVSLFLVMLSGVAMSHCHKDMSWEKPNTHHSNYNMKAWWGNSCWKSTLTDGKLETKGPGYGYWGKKVILIDNGVTHFKTAGTRLGPMIVYKQGNKLIYDYRKGSTGGCIIKDVVYKGDVKTAYIYGHRYGVSLTVITPAGQKMNYWIGEKGHKMTWKGWVKKTKMNHHHH